MKSSSLSPSDATWDAKEFRDRKGHDCQYKTYSTAPQIIPLCTISFASPSPAQTCEKKTNVGINSTQASQQECTNSTQITQLQGWTLQQVRNMHAGRRQPAPTQARAKKKEQDQKVTESAVSSAVLSIHCKLTQKCNQNIERNRPVNIKFRLDPLSNFNHSRAGILTIARDGGSRPNPRNHFALCSHTRYFCRGLEKSTARFPIWRESNQKIHESGKIIQNKKI